MTQVKVVQVPSWLAWLIAIPALVVAALFGFVVFVAALGVVLLFALYLGVRIWWLRRKARQNAGSEAIEGEYVVIRKARDDDHRDMR